MNINYFVQHYFIFIRSSFRVKGEYISRDVFVSWSFSHEGDLWLNGTS